MDIQTVGVVGAGVMGRGVAQTLAQTGHQVILLDLADEILDSAKQEIKGNIRTYNLFAKEKLAMSTDEILANITFSTDYELLAEVDFLVENATEKWKSRSRSISNSTRSAATTLSLPSTRRQFRSPVWRA